MALRFKGLSAALADIRITDADQGVLGLSVACVADRCRNGRRRRSGRVICRWTWRRRCRDDGATTCERRAQLPRRCTRAPAAGVTA